MSITAIQIAEEVNKAGGTAYYVGGCVRDKLLGRTSNDIDIEVHGLTEDELEAALSGLGDTLSFGRSFGVHTLKGTNIDIALPRSEYSTGDGHRDFEIMVDPFIGPETASRRRDFTINALMEDVLTGEILDFHGGLSDLDAGIIRHIDNDSFVEDPLRVLRACDFAARLGFEIADETRELCRGIDISTLSRERVEEELRKALLFSEKPSVFFEELRKMNHLSVWFSEIEKLIGIPQDPIFHPEGDVWVHTMEVIDRAAGFRDKVSDPFAFMLLALTHDLGKITATEFIKGRYHAYGHEVQGLPIVEEFLNRVIGRKDIKKYVKNMMPLHMRPNVAAYVKSSEKSTSKMFDEAIAPADLIYFAMSDKPVVSGGEPYEGDPGFLWERLKIFDSVMKKPYVSGEDLIKAGYEPGEKFGKLLEYAHKLRLAGVDKDSAMKQIAGYARTLK